MTKTEQTTTLDPRQSAYMRAYTAPDSPSFGNSYRSALTAGYSDQTARNLTHLNPDWRSVNIGQLVAIQPDELMKELTAIIQSETEPTLIRLKAIELNMRAYSMLVQSREPSQKVVTLNLDLTGSTSS